MTSAHAAPQKEHHSDSEWVEPRPSLFQHPLMGAAPDVLWTALRTQGAVSPRFWGHVLAFFASAVSRGPFRMLDREVLRRAHSEITIHPPVFIVGYWRSGTTHLHNLLGCSPGFGIITPLASGLPGELLTLGTWFRPLLENALPEDREVDDVAVTPRSPQEDEIPVANLQQLSVFHSLYFPRHFRRNFERGVFFDGVSIGEIEQWKQSLTFFLSKVAMHQETQPLLIKNPVYTARIDRLREIWPEARFIHIYRNPYTVYRSTVRYFERMLSKLALQPYDPTTVKPTVLDSYPRMLNRLYCDVADLPDDRFAEVKFETLEQRPLDELERVYRQLDLPEWEHARPATEQYLRGVSDYSKNTYSYGPEVRATVRSEWGEFVDRWGYEMPDA